MSTSGSLELRLFGAASIHARAGIEASLVLAQPKRFALLAYLAAATPYGFHRRDTLLGVFWPEADQEHGRTALRKSIHVLRRELGHELLVSRGAEVGLAEEVWCDVREFQRGLSSGRLAQSLALYEGDLLPGLFLAEAPEFERWLEETRGRLRHRAADAAWALSDGFERKRDPDQAAHWARWAWRLAADDERALRRLVGLFGRLGDRAGAIRVYEEFAGRLQRDYQVAPSPETMRLLEAISAGETGSTGRQPLSAETTSSPRDSAMLPTRPSREEGRRNIAIFPFRVHGDESVAYLHEGLVDLLSTNLDHAGSLHVIDPHALLSLTAREGDGPIDPGRAAALASHFGAHHYVLGSVVSAAGHLRISAALYCGEAASDSARHISAEGGAEQLFDMVDVLTAKLVGELHPGPGQRLVRLATTTTGSLPALKAYLAGEKALRGGRYVDAVDAFQRAVDQDPEFALAWYRLAFFLSWPSLPQPNMSPELAERALRHLERLSPRDGALLEAMHASLIGEADESERRYHELLAIHPEDVDGWIGLGHTLAFHNEGRGRAIVEARGPFERALALDPDNSVALTCLCYIVHAAGNSDESRALLARVPAESDFVLPRLVHAIRGGDPREREEVFQLLSTAPDAAVYEL
ncbi:MAG TPA: BTAD domain-containing putative transcriptional regulator, partial [Gemmatimonadales bacterium]